MSDLGKTPQEYYQQYVEENQQIVDEVVEQLKKDFPDEKQHQVVADIYAQVFKLTNQVEELSRHYMFLSSYIDSLYTHLVGDGKLITEEDFRDAAQSAYKASVDAITEAIQEVES